MNIEEIRNYCLTKPGVTEGFPFDETTLVFKVMNKMYALTGLEGDPPFINLKCDPERAIELRGQYEAIQPGWHMNKQHWNGIDHNANVPADKIRDWIDYSYELVVQGLKRVDREALEAGDF